VKSIILGVSRWTSPVIGICGIESQDVTLFFHGPQRNTCHDGRDTVVRQGFREPAARARARAEEIDKHAFIECGVLIEYRFYGSQDFNAEDCRESFRV